MTVEVIVVDDPGVVVEIPRLPPPPPTVARPTVSDDSGPGFITDEDTAFVTASVLDNDVGDTSTLSVGFFDSSGTTGSVSLVSADQGTFNYDPDGEFESLGVGASASDSWTYIAIDDDGKSEPATVTVKIDGVNDPPVARFDFVSTDEESPVGGNVLADNGLGADTDVDIGDVLGVSSVEGAASNVGTQLTLGSGALLTVQSDGSFLYDPNGAFEHVSEGSYRYDSWSYVVSDGNGGTDSTRVSVEIAGVDDPVVALPDSGPAFNTTEDVPFTTGNVLANDFDVDECVIGLFVESFDAATTKGGTIAAGAVEGTFDYQPAPGFGGTDTFTYRAQSIELCIEIDRASVRLVAAREPSAPATVTIQVAPVNSPPVANDDAGLDFATTAGSPFTTGNVLDNDTDPDDDDLFVSAFDAVSDNGASITSNGDGTFEYAPPVGFGGLDTFEYTVSDGLATDTAVVSIDVVKLGTPPTLPPPPTTTVPAATTPGPPPPTVPPPTTPGPPLLPPPTTTTTTTTTIAPPTVPPPGPGPGPSPGPGPAPGPAPIAPPSGTAPATTVTPTPPATNQTPQAGPDQGTTTPGGMVVISVVDNDRDPDGSLDLSTLRIVTQPRNGVAVLGSGGTVSYEPAEGFVGTDEFTYEICDDAGACAIGTVALRVDDVAVLPPVPDPPQTVEGPDTPPGEGEECDGALVVAESFTIDPGSGSVGTDVDLQLEVEERGLDDCRPPQVLFRFDGDLLAGPVDLSPNPGAAGTGVVPDLSPGTYEVIAETFTDPPFRLAATDFEITGGGGGFFDPLPSTPVTLAVAAAAVALLIIGAAVWRRRVADDRHPPLVGPPPDDCEDLRADAAEVHDAAVEARNAADLAAARAAESESATPTGTGETTADAAATVDAAATRAAGGPDAPLDPVAARATAAEADRAATEAEARAEEIADPWWDCEARVPRHQVPMAPGADEPERRRDLYYLLLHENPAADEHDAGRRGWYEPEREGPVGGIVIHTTGTDGAAEVAHYYATASRPVSAHVVVDDHGWIKLLPDDHVAHQSKNGDHALGVEIAYRADDWGSDPLHEDVLLRMAAAWCAIRARRHDIPVRLLTEEQWQDGERGFIGHDAIDWRHDDPGTDFPWERFLTLVAAMSGAAVSPRT